MEPKRKTWIGKTACDLCGQECVQMLIDGATKMGPWAVMCRYCHSNWGMRLGTGRGQLYVKAEGGTDFVKYDG